MDSLSFHEMLSSVCAYLCVTAAGGMGAAFLYYKYRRGKSWLPLPRLRWGSWSGGEVALGFFTLLLTQSMVLGVLQKINFFEWLYEGEPSSLHETLWIMPFTLAPFLALLFLALRGISGTFPADLGLSLGRWPANLLLGFVAFALATPLILALQGLLSSVSEVKQHQLVQLGKKGMTPLDWCMLTVSAIVAGPMIEEILFRGLILGWLRRASLAGHVTLIALVVFVSLGDSFEIKKDAKPPTEIEDLLESVQTIRWSRIAVTVGLGTLYVACLLRLHQRRLFLSEADFVPRERPEQDKASQAERTAENSAWLAQDRLRQRQKSGLAILGSTLAFALCHGSWPDPVPLLLLGLVLGWVAQRTQNLLPAIVTHMLFNCVGGLTLFFTVGWKSN